MANHLLTDAELLAKLIAFDSTSAHSNLPIADFIRDYLDTPGIEIAAHPNENGSKVNLLIRVGSHDHHDERSGLLLSGHMDVVPALEPDWQSDPFTLTETDDAYIGRGACDMKGFLAVAINAARRAVERRLRRPLVLLLTYDEELGTLGAQRFVETWDRASPLPRNTVIGEPTSLQIVRMHKGHLVMRLICHGRSAHSGYPHLGVNAIERMGIAIAVLTELRRRFETERCETSRFFAETPFVCVNLAEIEGGTATNIVPDRATLSIGVRLLPGMKTADYVPRFREALDAIDDLGDHALNVLSDSPPLLTDEDTEIYRVLCDLVSQSETLSVSYATDAGPLQSLGLDCVICGPGHIEMAHKPNESIPKAEFDRAAELLESLIRTCCT